MTHPWIASYPREIDWNAPLHARALYALLEDAEKQYGHRPCISFMGRRFSYRQVADKARRFAAALAAAGLKKGDRVGLFLPNCPQFIISYFGILMAGGIVVNFNPVYTHREIKHQIEDSGCRFMVTLSLKALYPKLAEVVSNTHVEAIIISDMCDALPFVKGLLFKWFKKKECVDIPSDAKHKHFAKMLSHASIASPAAVNPAEDVAVLQYTGGTTGVPKAVMLTHANIVLNAEQCGLWFFAPIPKGTKMIGVLPFFHVFAMTAVMNFAILKGIEILLHAKLDLKAILDDIAKEKPAFMPGVPSLFSALLNHKTLDQYDLTSLKYCISGGAPLPVEVKDAFEKKTGAVIVEGYGLSESSPVVAVNPIVGNNKIGSIGMPLPGTILEVVDIDDRTTLKPQGEKGEICIRGPQVMKGYWNKPEETANVLKHGRLHTGDIGVMDEQGYFHIVDRLKEMIISGGYNIYPRNIEEALYTHPAVLECAVIGLPDETRGQLVKAFVVKKDGAEVKPNELRAYLRDRIAPYSVPSKIEFRDNLPKSQIGKILKKELLAEEEKKPSISNS